MLDGAKTAGATYHGSSPVNYEQAIRANCGTLAIGKVAHEVRSEPT
jgi:hypothetical protein